jgi:hypothetical protein
LTDRLDLLQVEGLMKPILATAALLLFAPTAQADEGRKVLVLPYQPIYRSVEQTKAQTATDLLNKELSTKEGMSVVRGAVADEKEAASSLEEANKLQQEADQAEKERRIDDAISLRKKSIESMEKNAAAIADAETYLLAHHLLARSLMWAAQDKEAKDALSIVARMDPNMDLAADQFSRLYRKWFKAAAEEALRLRPATLTVRSTLPGAKISLDGREMDVAPVKLKKAVPGKHLITASIDGVPPAGAIVTIDDKKEGEFTISFAATRGGNAVGHVAEAIAQNELPTKAVQSAVQAGRDASAKYVVVGGMAKADDHFRVHTFVVDVEKSAVKPLEVVKFDLDLLTAESDVLRIVRGIEGSVAQFAGGQNEVKRIEDNLKVQSTVNEVIAAPTFASARTKKADAKKDDKRQIFKPLKESNVKIKDEEE